MKPPLLVGFAVLGVATLYLSHLLDERRAEERLWRELAVHCVGTAESANAVLQRCMAQLDARKRCVCFEEPLQSHAETTGAEP